MDALIEKGEPKISAILEVIRKYIKECKPIHFDGNGYSDEWKAEAARRGLDCETSCPCYLRQLPETGKHRHVRIYRRNDPARNWKPATK